MNATMAFAQPDPGWVIGKHALLCVNALRREGRTHLDVVRRRIPFQWQGYQYQDRDDQPYLQLHNSNGGYVEGDAALLQIDVQPGARMLLTTTGATRFYHCRQGGESRESIEVRIGPGALFEFLPDEMIPYADTCAIRSARFDLAPDARLFVSDTISAGRIHYRGGELFAFRALRAELAIRVDGRLQLLDRQFSTTPGQVRALRELWAGYRHLTTIAMHAPQWPRDLPDRLQAVLAAHPHAWSGVTRIGSLIVLRLLTRDAWHAQQLVFRIWRCARPDLAGKPARVIWKS
ncbi:MAG: urease accessory protein UreD [Burkholderiaceae bacterium]